MSPPLDILPVIASLKFKRGFYILTKKISIIIWILWLALILYTYLFFKNYDDPLYRILIAASLPTVIFGAVYAACDAAAKSITAKLSKLSVFD